MRRVSTMRMLRRSAIASIGRPSNIGRARSPRITGATYSSSSSTSPAARNAPASVAPASTWTSLMSRCGEQLQHRVEVEPTRVHRHVRVLRLRCRAACAHPAHACRASAHRLRGRGRARRWPGPGRARRAAAARIAFVVGRRPGARSAADRRSARCRRRSGSRRLRARQRCTSLSRGFAADPFRIARRQRAAPVEAGRELDAQPRPAALDAREEAAVELRAPALPSGRSRPRCRPRAGARSRAPSTCGIRIAHRADHARDARGDQRIGAGPVRPDVRAGLQRHVGGGAARALAGRLAARTLRRAARRRAGASLRRRRRHRWRSRSRRSGWAWW